jgi:nitrate reductase NapAB chaperone NapD
MSIASAVVEIQNGAAENVLAGLAQIPKISVFGLTENQIVTVIEGDDADDVERVVKEVQSIEHVIGVYPVFIGEP